MTARLVMNSEPTVLHATDTIATGMRYIMTHRFRTVPVVDEKRRYLGMFGVNCLLRLVLPTAALLEDGLKSLSFVSDSLLDLRLRLKAWEDKPVTSCLSREVPVVSPNTSLVETLLVLYRERAAVPVVEPDNGALVGVVTYWDVGARILEQEV
jgi:CBS-domain-containing membrane protein